MVWQMSFWRYAFVMLSLSCILVLPTLAQPPIFFADFDGNGIPNNDVNNPENWEPENPGTIWALNRFPANGTQALQMQASGCGTSGYTPLPGVENFTNGIIQFDAGWLDDDSIGWMVRQNGIDRGYFLTFGFTESLENGIFDLSQINYVRDCLGEGMALEEGPIPGETIIPGKAMAVTRHNLNPTDQTANTSYTGRIKVSGSEITMWYGFTEDFPDNPLTDPDPNAVASTLHIDNAEVFSGIVSFFHESWDNGFLDNVYVFDERGLAVISPNEKTTTTWASLKQSR